MWLGICIKADVPEPSFARHLWFICNYSVQTKWISQWHFHCSASRERRVLNNSFIFLFFGVFLNAGGKKQPLWSVIRCVTPPHGGVTAAFFGLAIRRCVWRGEKLADTERQLFVIQLPLAAKLDRRLFYLIFISCVCMSTCPLGTVQVIIWLTCCHFYVWTLCKCAVVARFPLMLPLRERYFHHWHHLFRPLLQANRTEQWTGCV